MKIGIYDPYLDTLGGGEKYMLTIAECLSKGNSVDVFWDEKKIRLLTEVRFRLDLSKVSFVDNIFSSHVPFLIRLFKTRAYDVIIFLSDGSIPFVLSKKLILHFQFPVEWVRTDSLATKLKLLRVNNIICNSYYTKTFIDKKFKKKSIVLYPPIDEEDLSYVEPLDSNDILPALRYRSRRGILSGSPKEDVFSASIPISSGSIHPRLKRRGILEASNKKRKENIILTVGRYSKLPNGSDFKKQTVLIETFKKMVDRGLKSWQFIIVTSYLTQDKEFVNELEKQAEGYPIKIARNVPHSEVIDLYKKSKIYWHAAGYGEDIERYPDRAEHFGIATAEAMSAGCVPIVFNAGGQKEIIKEDGSGGFLWNTIDELIKKTNNLIDNEKLWENTSLIAWGSIDYFRKEKFCKELRDIIS